MYVFGLFLYNLHMGTVSVSEARKKFAAVIESAQAEAVVVEKRGEPQAVVLSPQEYARLVADAELAEDTTAFDEAMAEEGPNIPWEQVKADLGW